MTDGIKERPNRAKESVGANIANLQSKKEEEEGKSGQWKCSYQRAPLIYIFGTGLKRV